MAEELTAASGSNPRETSRTSPAPWPASTDPAPPGSIAAAGLPEAPATSGAPAPFTTSEPLPAPPRQDAAAPLKPAAPGPAQSGGHDASQERHVRRVAGAAAVQPDPLSSSLRGDAGAEGFAAPASPQQTSDRSPAEGPERRPEGSSDALAVLSAIAGSFSEAVRFADLQHAAAAGGGDDGSAEGDGYGGFGAAARADGGAVTSGDGLDGGPRSKRRNVLNELHAEAQALEAAIRRMQGLCTSSRYSGFRALLEQTPEFPAALSQALQQLAHCSSRMRNILVSNPVDFRVATEACNECIATYNRVHQLRGRVYSQPRARALLTGSHLSSTHPALQAIVGDMPLSQWMQSFLSTDGANLAPQPFENCRELLVRWRMHERQLEEQLESLHATMRSTASENVSHLLQQSLQLAPAPDGNSVVILKSKSPGTADGLPGDSGGGGSSADPRSAAAASAGLPPDGAGAAGAASGADAGGGGAYAHIMPLAAPAPQAVPQQASATLLTQCVQALRQNEEFRSVALQQLQALLPPVDMLRFLAVRFEVEDACKHLVRHVEPQPQAPAFMGSGTPPVATGGAAAVNLTQAQPGGSWPKPPTG